MKILVGTSKGLIVYEGAGTDCRLAAVHFKGLPVSMIHHQPAGDRWWIALAIKHWGPKLFVSEDGLQTWQERGVPKYPDGAVIRPNVPATLRLIWSGATTEWHGDNQLWLGTEPGGLFRSDDEGRSFHLVESLWRHESRVDHWFGGGRNEAGIHTVLVHPEDDQKLMIGVSCGGVFATEDGGTSWAGKNLGLRADYLPHPFAQYGHDPHSMGICRANPQVIWQQNHCGVFRSTDGGEKWQDVTPSNDYGRYGFAIAIDPEDPLRAWIVPAESDEQRVAKDQQLLVYYTADGGETWAPLESGLPKGPNFDLVFRHALDRRGKTLAFGTTTGNLYVSDNDGAHWHNLSHHLPPIHSIYLHFP